MVELTQKEKEVLTKIEELKFLYILSEVLVSQITRFAYTSSEMGEMFEDIKNKDFNEEVKKEIGLLFKENKEIFERFKEKEVRESLPMIERQKEISKERIGKEYTYEFINKILEK